MQSALSQGNTRLSGQKGSEDPLEAVNFDARVEDFFPPSCTVGLGGCGKAFVVGFTSDVASKVAKAVRK